MAEAPRRLGIIAGAGTFPGQVAAAAQAAGREVFIIALEGFAEARVIGAYPHAIVRMGAAGRIIELLRANACQDIVLIGRVRRPSIFEARPDAFGARLLARVGRVAFGGDDSLLAAVVKVLGEEGFTVVGAHEVMTEALAPAGLLTRAAPDTQAMGDIRRGVAVCRALGAADVGQGCVVQLGLVLAVEAIEGTDAMIARAGQLARAGTGGVLVKLSKPGQERRADLPALGPVTVANAAAAGLRGIAFEAGGALLADRDAAVRAADAAGIFLIGIDPAQL